MRFCLLGSGSRGNAILVVSRFSKILIDNGLTFKRLRSAAAEIGEPLQDLKAVFITHEHTDHISGLGTLARSVDVPIYMTQGTHAALSDRVGKLPRVEFIEAGEAVVLDGMTVGSFSVSHDAADPVSYVVEAEGAKLGIAADLGHPTHLVRQRLAGSHGLVLESNYCPEMLRRGSYPPMIQQRIHGRQGHLSNHDMCSLLSHLIHAALQVVVLVHISQENNTHDVALKLAQGVLKDRSVRLFAAAQNAPTPVFELGP